ncbi:Long-chain-fatty-acid--CoA ligase [[Actinomadura] parvosata subsp. kistnae]|uniref:AMP-dependent synthetase n=1 Tax=[Actinomadura] parvosata subsp. kistnae TaxID=1909395 RepID=A0A1V0A4J3_9ACTN|nr:fatty acid--CoA ligase family protein [Nonomuraea sp. ATCC 55076]AQZ65124.1 AMP-dependent synthetase [Nonomuraea sp. ATCC 55076]SPL96408.1 Long-chain-fatty-acid--CoA ligase [Actinomadura parvosata subsp. kistnae]
MPAEVTPGEPYPGPVLDLLAAAGDRTVFEHGTRTVSGARMLGLVRRIAAGLRAAGLGPGDGVAMMLGVTPEAFAAIIAGHVVGARVVGVRPGLPPAQLHHVLHQDVDATVTDDDGGTLSLSGLLSTPDEGGRPELSARPGDVARLLYTSGSTGTPKACAQTYAAMSAAWTARPEAWPPAIKELASRLGRYLVFGSLSSQVMMEYGVLTLAAGGTMVVADPPAFPDAITRLRATASVITVPRLYKLVAAQRRRPADLSSLRALMVSGSPLEASRLREARDVLGPVVFHGYGQTETGTISMATPQDVPPSVGIPPDVIDVEARSPDGRPVPPGVDGELYVRTPAQAIGYWADPGQSAEVFVDGWVRTRDLGHFDHDGRLYLTGRTRDVIIINANLHYAGPIERALAAAPGIAEAYVVGAPDEETGEAAHAFVVLEPGRTPDPAALRERVAERLGDACVPATITVIDEVPVGPNGKPDKRLLLPAR